MRKALIKAITWRVIGTSELLAVAYLSTGDLSCASHIAGLGAATSVALYVVHEHLWALASRKAVRA